MAGDAIRARPRINAYRRENFSPKPLATARRKLFIRTVALPAPIRPQNNCDEERKKGYTPRQYAAVPAAHDQIIGVLQKLNTAQLQMTKKGLQKTLQNGGERRISVGGTRK
jgi:hypothetical protein